MNRKTRMHSTTPISWPKAEVRPPPLHWMNAPRKSRRMAESIEKTQALDDLAQFAAGIDGALEAGTVDSLCQVKRVLGIHRNELFAHLGDQAVTIGERLRALRKEKKLSQRDIAKKRRCFAATCGVWKLAVKFRPSKHLRKWLALWRSRSTNTFTMTKRLQSYRIFRNVSLPKTLSGAIPAKPHICSPCSVACSPA